MKIVCAVFLLEVNFYRLQILMKLHNLFQSAGLENVCKLIDLSTQTHTPVALASFHYYKSLFTLDVFSRAATAHFSPVCVNDAIHFCVSSRQPTLHMQGESRHRGGFQTAAATCEQFHKQTLNNRQRISNRELETALRLCSVGI